MKTFPFASPLSLAILCLVGFLVSCATPPSPAPQGGAAGELPRLESFLGGFRFGMTQEEVVARMGDRQPGSIPAGAGLEELRFTGGELMGSPVSLWIFSFEEGTLAAATVLLPKGSDTRSGYLNMVDLVQRSFGQPAYVYGRPGVAGENIFRAEWRFPQQRLIQVTTSHAAPSIRLAFLDARDEARSGARRDRAAEDLR